MVKIRKLMKPSVPTIKEEVDAGTAARSILKGPSDFAVVIDKNSIPLGVISLHDLMVHITQGGKTKDDADLIMNRPVIDMQPEMTVDQGMKLIDTERLRKFPVIEDDKVIGTITDKEIVYHTSQNVRFHRNLQNIVLITFVLFELFTFFIFPLIKF